MKRASQPSKINHNNASYISISFIFLYCALEPTVHPEQCCQDTGSRVTDCDRKNILRRVRNDLQVVKSAGAMSDVFPLCAAQTCSGKKQRVDYPSRNLLSGCNHIAPPTATQHDSVHTSDISLTDISFACKQPETVLSREPELFSAHQWVEQSQNWCECDLNYLPPFTVQYIQSHSDLHYILASPLRLVAAIITFLHIATEGRFIIKHIKYR